MKLSDYIKDSLVDNNIELFDISPDNQIDDYLNWLSDPKVNKYLEVRFQKNDIQSLISYIDDCINSPTIMLLGIKRLDTGAYIGNVKLNCDFHHKMADIGIMIGDSNSWSKGFASLAIRLICKVGFESIGLHKIVAGAYISNQPSIRAFEKNGFKVEAILKKHVILGDDFEDVCLMRLFDNDYYQTISTMNGLENNSTLIQSKWVDSITKALKLSDLKASIVQHDNSDWDDVWAKMPYQPVCYHNSMIDYQSEYHRSMGWVILNTSLILEHDGKLCGLWHFTLGLNRGRINITSSGLALLPPLFVSDIASSSIKAINTKVVNFVGILCSDLNITSQVYQSAVLPSCSHFGLSEWQKLLLRRGMTARVYYELFSNLSLDVKEIREGFRRSYKSLINKGLNLFSYEVVDSSNITASIWSEFESLHLNVAGKKTRSTNTWMMQYQMVCAGTAFLITVREKNGNLIGGAFFQHTRDEGLYSVAAYDRNFFDKPIGHAVQLLAIERMKRLGLAWYRIGNRPYLQDAPMTSKKEISIGEFKQGFSTNEFVRYEYSN